MDYTPPLTGSPASPPTSYCPSDRSSPAGYPSPDLAGQQCGIKLYGSHCPLSDSHPGSGNPHGPMDNNMGQHPWAQASTQLMPSIISNEYSDAFDSFDSTSFGHQDVFIPEHHHHNNHNHNHNHHQQHQQHGSTSPHSSPAPAQHLRSPLGPLRSPMGYTPDASLLHQPFTPRIKIEPAPLDLAAGTGVSHYPSPSRSLHSYQTDVGIYPAPVPSSDYLSDTQSSGWSSKDYVPNNNNNNNNHKTIGSANSNNNNNNGGSSSSSIAYYGAEQATLAVASATAVNPGGSDKRPSLVRSRPRKKLTTKEDANFYCEVKGCGKMFGRSYNYKAHMETHDDKREYPFPCQAAGCTKRFVRKTDLQRHHQSVHTKERNHKCDFCGRTFARKDTLRRHMEDGCPKRFDVTLVGLRNDDYPTAARPDSSSGLGGMLPPSPATHNTSTSGSSSTLPPLAMSSIGAHAMMLPATTGGRDMLPHDDVRPHGWTR